MCRCSEKRQRLPFKCEKGVRAVQVSSSSRRMFRVTHINAADRQRYNVTRIGPARTAYGVDWSVVNSFFLDHCVDV